VDGKLAVAWLPTPLPLPSGEDPRGARPTPPVPEQHPQPGAGWTVLDPVDVVEGLAGVPEPGADTDVRSGSWQAGGGALLRVGGATLLLTPQEAYTLPADVRPMAMMLYQPGLFGALGPRLVVCDPRCRILDPGPTAEIVAVVPRTERTIVLGYADGRIGTYDVPATGGEPVEDHPLAERLRAVLKSRPPVR